MRYASRSAPDLGSAGLVEAGVISALSFLFLSGLEGLFDDDDVDFSRSFDTGGALLLCAFATEVTAVHKETLINRTGNHLNFVKLPYLSNVRDYSGY